ncbi:MAG: isocitrate lyase/phosphoenolpyruvate mutase family protein [Pseudomonadota bacterium]
MSNTFHALHRQAGPLMLPNAWDASSARLIESLGARAIATTSAGVAWSLGYRDGDVLPIDQHLASIAAIARVVTVPLSVDIEGGYSDDPSAVGETVARLIELGVVGINLQDGAAHPDLLCAKIDAARRAADRLGVALYINARTDVFCRALVAPGERVAETLARAARYRDAGADGLFTLGLAAPAAMRAIAAGTPLLLNVIAWPGLPSAQALSALGVRRVSVGSWIPQTLWAHTSALVTGFLADGRSEPLFTAAAPYAQVNATFEA